MHYYFLREAFVEYNFTYMNITFFSLWIKKVLLVIKFLSYNVRIISLKCIKYLDSDYESFDLRILLYLKNYWGSQEAIIFCGLYLT